ncbi:MAG: AraC family transcriptional regulator [Cyanobacteria bacterium SID2]|nr:AraC family transcriptional regulator [Cyanobacteria bacterium SID2]
MNASLTVATPLIAMRLQIARACGINTDLVLKRVGLNPTTLLNPMAKLTLAQDNAIWREIIALGGNPAIGLKFGQYVKLSGIGIVGYVMMNTRTAAEGMQRFCKYERLLTNAYHSEIARDKYHLACITHCEGDWQPERRCTIDFVMSAMRTLAVDLAIDPRAILQVQFQFDRPAHIEPYTAVFDRAVLKFGCPDSRLIFSSDVAETPVIGANPELLAVFDRQAEMLLSKYERDNLSDRVRQKIAERLKGETPALSEIATQLHLSSRSLQLKLQEEGTSYQMLLDEVRRDAAISYLQNSQLSKTEIAYLLGFSEVSVFSRTFKRWTGQAPSKFQQQNVQ